MCMKLCKAAAWLRFQVGLFQIHLEKLQWSVFIWSKEKLDQSASFEEKEAAGLVVTQARSVKNHNLVNNVSS